MMKNKKEISRSLQEKSYNFPYHYLVNFKSEKPYNFSQYKNNPGGYRYVSYLLKVIWELEKIDFSTIVDVGCGDGFFAGKMSNIFPHKKIVGIDISEQAINLAKLLNNNHNVNFAKKNIGLDKMEQSFDVATLIEVLEHIPPQNIDSFLNGLYNVIKKDGILILTVPSTNLPIGNIKRHFQHFTADSLNNILSKYFYLDKIEYINSNNFSSRLIHHIYTNPLFILNNDNLKRRLFNIYIKRCLTSDRNNGLRIFAKFKKLKSLNRV